MSKPKKRVSVMPAIREESNMKTNRIPVHIIPPGTKAGPLRQSMVIQNLPDEPKQKARHPPPKIGPSNGYAVSAVDQIVSQYLHQSEHDPIMHQPSYQGFAPAPCPCCMDRNKENLKRLMDKHRAPLPAPDPESLSEPVLNNPNPVSGSGEAGQSNAAPMYSYSPRRSNNNVGFADTVDVREISPRHQTRDVNPVSWAEYQPQPYLAGFDPQFNRHMMLQGFEQDRRQYEDANTSYVSGQILDANTKYDLAMKKLEKTLHRFDSRSLSREDSDYPD